MDFRVLQQKVIQVSETNFEEVALEIFHFQAEKNPVYRQYLAALKVDKKKITSLYDVPFLPIEFFKNFTVLCENLTPMMVFESSRTTGSAASKHYLVDADFYASISKEIFEYSYGSLNDYHLLALLPSYLERKNSSLVFMVERFMAHTQSPSGFFLDNFKELSQTLQMLQKARKKVLLIGVTFALLDFASQYPADYEGVTVMETGGMKGRRREMIRAEVHEFLKEKMNLTQIHSEYGMTELLSQFYATHSGLFQMNRFAKVFLREVNDPFSIRNFPKSGAINVVDLANIHSCSFIATQDLGKAASQRQFEVIGRIDNTETRGCSLMWT